MKEPERRGGESAETTAALSREFGLLLEMTRTIQDAARILLSGLQRSLPLPQAWAEIRDLEHKGDAIARDLFDAHRRAGRLHGHRRDEGVERLAC